MRRLRAIVLPACGLLGAASAFAQACTVTASGVAFGSYNPLASVPTDATGLVTVSCAANPIALVLGYSIALSAGGSGSVAARSMSAGANALGYQLYRDAPRSAVWGDGSGGSSPLAGGLLLSLLLPASAAHPIYGRIPALQAGTRAGSYGDTLTVTVSY
ncbi:MAG TPA: spore coat U domain-containing protein [Methylibium sp.]|nr:spore coat U domain-containing protein [Methylibium sp.]